MATHVHFDEAAIAAANDKIAASLVATAAEGGCLGVQARLVIATMKTINLAIVAEINRGSEYEHICTGVANIISNMVLTCAQANPENIDAILARVEECLERSLSGEPALGGVEHVAKSASGRA